MNVLLVHNTYQQPGGEDQVFAAEQENLRRHGLNIHTYSVSNDSIQGHNQLQVAAQTLWNRQQAGHLARLVQDHGIEVVHFHNTFPLISPAAYWAVRRAGAAAVQTLHNFRLSCAPSTLYRVHADGVGRVCEECLGKRVAVGAVQHRCYRDSRAGSAVVAAMQATHWTIGSYRRQVDAYIALTDFGRDKMVQAGLDRASVRVKPNFLAHDPGLGAGDGGYALYVGRLTREKGVLTLLEAWREVSRELPLKIVGDGPLLEDVQQLAAGIPGVEVLGRRSSEEVAALMGRATLLTVTSEWYETFTLVSIEAAAAGVPVLASRIGVLTSVVEDGVSGLHFRPGDPRDLAAQVRRLQDPALRAQLSRQARARFLERYTADINFEQQLDIYRFALERRHRQPQLRPAQAGSSA
ncbi:glycosyltransferase family 4 protein [Deinococcus sonorensis]|uniref:Glycosyltransferase family 4 protein n=2 Tax=Deinococcus sonorensis TaxID=309891 RepID=A0AAU7UD34_9DEIO